MSLIYNSNTFNKACQLSTSFSNNKIIKITYLCIALFKNDLDTDVTILGVRTGYQASKFMLVYIYEVKKYTFFVNYVCNNPKIATLQSKYCYGFQNFLYEPKKDFSSGIYHGFLLCLHPSCIGNPLPRVENRRSK